MPEGPEIRRLADELGAVLTGQRLEEVYFAFPGLRPFAARLSGQPVVRVYPRGKALLIEAACGLTVYTHNQLYGIWRVVARGQPPPTGRQLRLALHTGLHSCLLYSASEIDVLDAARLADHPFLRRLGPDVLAPDTGLDELLRRYRGEAFARRRLGALLLLSLIHI